VATCIRDKKISESVMEPRIYQSTFVFRHFEGNIDWLRQQISQYLMPKRESRISPMKLREFVQPDSTLSEIAAKIKLVWNSVSHDLADIQRWLGHPKDEAGMDAGLFAQLAADKWLASDATGGTASSIAEIRAMIERDQQTDVTAMLVVKSGESLPRWPHALGLALIHRTWSGNLYIDFLAAHPNTLETTRGIGLGLLCLVTRIAIKLEAPTIWAETTKLSAPFYQHVFDLPNALGDRLEVTLDQAKRFNERVSDAWAAQR
jgi:hypothetical protein